MSSGADCVFTEQPNGKWNYQIQQWPYGDWPDYDVHGPFASFEKARDHLDENYQNPGGYSVHQQERSEGDALI